MPRKNIYKNPVNVTAEEVQAASKSGNVVLLTHCSDSYDLLEAVMQKLDLPESKTTFVERFACIVCEGKSKITKRSAHGVIKKMRYRKFAELRSDEADYRWNYFWKAMEGTDPVITRKVLQTVIKSEIHPGEISG